MDFGNCEFFRPKKVVPKRFSHRKGQYEDGENVSTWGQRDNSASKVLAMLA